MSVVTRLFWGPIENERQLAISVVKLTSVCIVLALGVDITNQLTFFVDWSNAFRSWGITTAVVLMLAIPISRTIGQAQLELHRVKEHAKHLSLTDQLTGLPNRRALLEIIPRQGEARLALVIADIDRFKRVNDQYGHLVGDVVIAAVGQRMSEHLADLGMLVRVGGEEFALLAPGVSAAALEARLNAFREWMAATPIEADGESLRVTLSAGIADSCEGDTFERLYSAADRALYAAKASGRNRVLRFDQIRALRERLGPRAQTRPSQRQALSA